MPASRLSFAFSSAALLSATAVLAQSLPETGKLDDSKVTQARYGSAAAPAAGLPPGAKAAPQANASSAPATFQTTPDWGDAITGVVVEAEDAGGKASIPVTFGQVFAPGDLKRGDVLHGRLADGRALPLQVDVKATHPDGSVRHAVISAVLPGAGKAGSQALALVKGKESAAKPAAPASVQALLDAGFSATASASIGGQAWTASADKLLRQKPEVWLDGPLVTEWLVSAPLRNEKGVEHPRLSARFAVRWYRALGKARVDVSIENAWAFQPAPRNETYDASIQVGGKEVYAKQDLVHYNQARWRKTFWWGEVPAVHLRHDSAYLMASRALPNYDRSVHVADRALAELKSKWSGERTEPMGIGLAVPYMPTTGGRNDIGLLPGWAAMYLLSMDKRAAEATLGTADLAGSWSVHYRDRKTGRPVSLIDYPYMGIFGTEADKRNPKTGKSEAFPPCPKDACKTPYHADVSHQPSFAYLPYLLTGDYYYLEELEFWGMYDVFESVPGYRDFAKGLVKQDQVRGQAWALRTLGEAAYIVPDKDPLKAHFRSIVKSNMDWFNAAYTDNPAANKLGFIANGHAIEYKNGTGIAPWMDDFFTAAVGHLTELGAEGAGRLLAWKATFPIQRMTAPGACWTGASIYALIVRDSSSAPFYPTMAQAWRASQAPGIGELECGSPALAQALKLKSGEMIGYASSNTGFPANLQPALAYAADAGGKAGQEAWRKFMARSVKPDYGMAPQFAIVPRGAQP
ncbi:hypothetical protein SRABI118_00868 [Massilia sp. Bi118]|uniref:RIFT barrel domain-containing protein n=1 Tax=Massilia sp. Bi118 TaxID=2822346 RepID=UPI001DEDE8F1|nr:hypothetical protein [Massilia sp. Bi118]CAH0165517.1 hypothetical protein SRABI118_00868 [Massilia sp. Bi118]